jgi:hypothetical protein
MHATFLCLKFIREVNITRTHARTHTQGIYITFRMLYSYVEDVFLVNCLTWVMYNSVYTIWQTEYCY